ncbi:ABC transporter substrate-binding protein, partial [Brachyspira hampsonii]
MKKTMLVSILSIALIALIISCSGGNNTASSQTNSSLDKIRVAYMADFSGTSAAAIAQEKGFFKEENLDVELVKFLNGPSEVAAMLSGDIQFAYIGHGAHSLAIQGKVNVLFPNGLSKSEQILVGKWANINAISDLRGKTVGTQLGTSGEILLNLALDKAGVNRAELNVVNMDVSGIVSSMIGKKVDAVSVWAPYTFEITKQLGDQVESIATIIDYSDEGVFPSSWVVTPSYQKNNPDIVNRFSKAILKAMDYRGANIDEAVEIVAKVNGTPVESVSSEKETALWLTGEDIKNNYSDGTAA